MASVAVSRDGRGRALENVFVERLRRSVKYEDIYFLFYDEERPHQSLGYRTPDKVYRSGDRTGGSRVRAITNPDL